MKTALTLLLILFSYYAKAQDGVALRLEKVSKVLFMVGNWEGKGWMLMPDGRKEHFDQTEKISAKLDNAVILVEGMGKLPENGKVIHNAMALLTYDVAKQQYRWTSTTTRSGYILDVIPEVSDNKFVWSLNSPVAGKIRYTITLDKGDWLEIGEVSKDGGQTWKQNFEMRLKKLK